MKVNAQAFFNFCAAHVPLLRQLAERTGELSETEVMRLLGEHLDSRDLVILYGHPSYEGVRDAVLRKVFATVMERGFRFVTMQSLAERFQAAAATR